jgi:hypothetical protein
MTSHLTDNDVLLVDVGGNQGHDLVRFRKKHPQAPGRLILQDLPAVVAGHTDETIEAMAYSFLDPQPVKGESAIINMLSRDELRD